jgi:transposase InsO family protein
MARFNSRYTHLALLTEHACAPQRGKKGSWETFLKAHWEVLAATDFFTVEVWTLGELVTHYVLFFIELATRSVRMAGITTEPNDAFMVQTARNLTDVVDGFLFDKRYLILDRDTKYSLAFRGFLKREGIDVVRLPPRSPNLNAYAERFVRSIKEELINRMIFLDEASLHRALHEYMAHYHNERNHQGLDNRLIKPSNIVAHPSGVIHRRERLGGMLSYYHRQAA